jgi:hypothetical protein
VQVSVPPADFIRKPAAPIDTAFIYRTTADVDMLTPQAQRENLKIVQQVPQYVEYAVAGSRDYQLQFCR